MTASSAKTGRVAGRTAAAALCLALGVGLSPARAADAAAGKALFDRTCTNCHSTQIGVNKVGPSLFNVVGRPVASVQGYDYSPKLREMAKRWKVWDPVHLDTYLTNPRQVLHGVRMYFAVPDATDRANLISYLSTLK